MIRLIAMIELGEQMHKNMIPQNPNMSPNVRKNNSKTGKSMPCQFSKQGSCPHTSTHETRGLLYISVPFALHR